MGETDAIGRVDVKGLAFGALASNRQYQAKRRPGLYHNKTYRACAGRRVTEVRNAHVARQILDALSILKDLF